MVIPGPEIKKRIRKTKQDHRRQPDPLIDRQTSQNRTERKTGNDIDKNLRLHQREQLRPKQLEEKSGDYPIYPPQRRSKITEWQLAPAHPISTFPGQKNIYPIRQMDK